MNLAGLNSSFAHVPIDWILIGAVVILITAYSLYWGVSRALALSLAIPVAYTLTAFLPHTAYLGNLLSQMAAGYSGAIIVAITILILTVCIDVVIREYGSSAAPMPALLVGIGTSIVLFVFWIQMSQLSAVWHFSSTVLHIFGVTYAFFWLVGAYLLLAFARR